jgi:hypothetical protein
MKNAEWLVDAIGACGMIIDCMDRKGLETHSHT